MVVSKTVCIIYLFVIGICEGNRILVTDSAHVTMPSLYRNFKSDNLFDGNTTFDSCCCSMTEYESNPYFIIDLGAERPLVELKIYGGDINMYGGAGNLLDTSIWLQEDTSGPANLTIREPRESVTFTFPRDIHARTIHIVRHTRNRFALCELELWSPDLVSLGKTVISREERRCNAYQKYSASHAVDGVYNSQDMCTFCASVDDFEIDPWIQLDLGRPHLVSFISVYGRTNRAKYDLLDNIQIFLDPVDDVSEPLYHETSPVVTIHIPLTPGRMIQYVTIVRIRNYILTVCEIMVYTRECSGNMYGDDCSLSCGHCKNTSCDVIDGHCQQCQSGYYGSHCMVSGVPMTGSLVTTSSVLESIPSSDDWSPAHAIDGTVECGPDYHLCCSSTGNQSNPWLELQLPARRYVSQIDIIGYADQIDDFLGLTVFISVDDNKAHTDPVYSQQTPHHNGTSVSISLDPPVGTLFVTLVLPGDNRTLVVCEIFVFGKDCQQGKYGLDCSFTCGQCLHGQQCDLVDGTCEGCDPGYRGTTCTDVCQSGTYGQNCSEICGHCPMKCHHVTGTCISCNKDYYGSKCLDRIVSVRKPVTLSTLFDDPSQFFWSGLKAVDEDSRMFPYICLCCSGTMQEAEPWLQIDLLQPFRLSHISIYGRMDHHEISLHHVKVYLAPVAGAIGEPYHSWTDYKTSVDIVVDPLQVSRYVTVVMAHEGHMSALFVCEIQVFAEECEEGWFGTACTSLCRCLDGLTCDPLTGVCPDDLCTPGWIGPSCDIACPDGYFGMDCAYLCGACVNSELCDKVTGVCLNGCVNMYFGPVCKDMQSPMSSEAAVWGFITFGSILTLSTMAFIAFKLRRLSQIRRERAYRLPPPNETDELIVTEVQIAAKQAEFQESVSSTDEEC